VPRTSIRSWKLCQAFLFFDSALQIALLPLFPKKQFRDYLKKHVLSFTMSRPFEKMSSSTFPQGQKSLKPTAIQFNSHDSLLLVLRTKNITGDASTLTDISKVSAPSSSIFETQQLAQVLRILLTYSTRTWPPAQRCLLLPRSPKIRTFRISLATLA
jgi:hypothetical protein